MAHYTYENIRDLIPDHVMTAAWYRAVFCPGCDTRCKMACEYDGDPNYDGDMWSVAAEYLGRIKQAAEAVLVEAGPEQLAALRKALDGEPKLED